MFNNVLERIVNAFSAMGMMLVAGTVVFFATVTALIDAVLFNETVGNGPLFTAYMTRVWSSADAEDVVDTWRGE